MDATEKKDIRFMELALAEAKNALSKNEFPVGCVLEYQGKIIASGSRTGSTKKIPNETDHAEINALRSLFDLGREFNRSDITIYSTMEPCLMCFGAILITGIGRVVYAYEDVMGGGTSLVRSNLSPLYRDRRITITPGVLREKALELFQAFYQYPGNVYWKDSLLAKYTMNAK